MFGLVLGVVKGGIFSPLPVGEGSGVRVNVE